MIFEEPIVELLISMVVEIVVASGRTEEQDRRRSGTDFSLLLGSMCYSQLRSLSMLEFQKTRGSIIGVGTFVFVRGIQKGEPEAHKRSRFSFARLQYPIDAEAQNSHDRRT